MTPRNPIVERVARQLYAARYAQRKWEALAEHRRQGYCGLVEEVMLAALNAGLVIQEWVPGNVVK